MKKTLEFPNFGTVIVSGLTREECDQEAGFATAWYEMWRDRPGDIPFDIPKRPDLVYKNEWISWAHWCQVQVLN
jgi:hypothetical protein